jgi:hypothetical protein
MASKLLKNSLRVLDMDVYPLAFGSKKVEDPSGSAIDGYP